MAPRASAAANGKPGSTALRTNATLNAVSSTNATASWVMGRNIFRSATAEDS